MEIDDYHKKGPYPDGVGALKGYFTVLATFAVATAC
jgi:hypothetical protein